MNSDTVELKAADGHELRGYRAQPGGTPKGGVVVLQEIFGVTNHIRRVTDQFAEVGYLAIAPALFDRIEPGVELEYTAVAKGREYRAAAKPDQTVLDIEAALDALRPVGKIGVVGYCWGGGMAYLAACRLTIDAAIAYYGGPISEYLDLRPRCPVMYHFGAQDSLIPMETVSAVRKIDPEGIFHIYENSGHGFNCDEREDYNPQDAKLALERSLAFLGQYLQTKHSA